MGVRSLDSFLFHLGVWPKSSLHLTNWVPMSLGVVDTSTLWRQWFSDWQANCQVPPVLFLFSLLSLPSFQCRKPLASKEDLLYSWIQTEFSDDLNPLDHSSSRDRNVEGRKSTVFQPFTFLSFSLSDEAELSGLIPFGKGVILGDRFLILS